jgi:CYTH domain-containing protein
MANIETELKFLLKRLPNNVSLDDFKDSDEIIQTYLSTKQESDRNNIQACFEKLEIPWQHVQEARIRSRINILNPKQVNYFVTLKSDGLSERTEFEVEIDTDKYNHLYDSISHLGQIQKTRYIKPISQTNLVMELDVFGSQHKGLMLLEVEFSYQDYVNEQAVVDLVYREFGFLETSDNSNSILVNVTRDKAYKNANLALHVYNG